jgi:hypothetical protein
MIKQISIFILFLAIVLSQHWFSNVSFSQANISYTTSGDGEEYTYVRELRNGIWWIIVYNSDGKIINEYPDPEQ